MYSLIQMNSLNNRSRDEYTLSKSGSHVHEDVTYRYLFACFLLYCLRCCSCKAAQHRSVVSTFTDIRICETPTSRATECHNYFSVFIITDDQDVKLNSLSVQPKVQKLLMEEGLFFQNAFVTHPVCCPSR